MLTSLFGDRTWFRKSTPDEGERREPRLRSRQRSIRSPEELEDRLLLTSDPAAVTPLLPSPARPSALVQGPSSPVVTPSYPGVTVDYGQAVAGTQTTGDVSSGLFDALLALPGGTATPESSGASAPLSEQALESITNEAIRLWSGVPGVGAKASVLNGVQIQIKALPGQTLAEASGDVVAIDPTAAGYGWFTDDSGDAFAQPDSHGLLHALPGGAASGQMDLLTVVAHELGDILGLTDTSPAARPGDVMGDTLATGERRLPGPSQAAVPVIAPTAPTGSSSVLDFQATAPSNMVTLRRDGPELQVVDSHTGSVLAERPLAGTTGVVVDGLAGADDTLTIDFSGGAIPLPIAYNGAPGGYNTLDIVGGHFTSSRYQASGPSSGTIALDATTIHYTGLSPIIDTTTVDARVFVDPNAGTQHIRLIDDGNPTNGFSKIDSPTGDFESVAFKNPATSLTIDTGTGNATVQIVSVDNGFNAPVFVNGQGGDDTLQGGDAPSLYVIDGTNSGHIALTGSPPSGVPASVTFSGFAHLVGGSGSNVFQVAGNASFPGTIQGGSGANAFQITLGASLGSPTISATGSTGAETLTVISTVAGDHLTDSGSAVTSSTFGATIHYSGLTAPPTLSTPSDLDGFIQSEIAAGVSGLVGNLGPVVLGGFLEIQGLSLNFASGSVAITATSASFFPGSSHTIVVSGNGGPGIVGTYTTSTHQYTLQLAQVTLNAPGVMTAQTTNVTINYQKAGAANQTLVTIGSIQIVLPALANTAITVSNLVIREDGFSLSNATVPLPSVTWLNALTLTTVGVTFSNVNYTKTNDTLAGTITLTAGSVGLFQGQSTFTSTVTGFSGTYTLGTKSLSLAASSVTLVLGGTVGLAANNVSFGLDANAGIFSLTTGPATINISQTAFLTGSFSLRSGQQFGVSFVGGSPAPKAVSAITIGGSNVFGFFGSGGPYWQDTNGVVTAQPGANTYGIALGGLNFGLALLAPTSPADTSSYYALSATADQVTPVFPGSPVTLSASNLSLSVNGSRAPPGVNTPIPAIDFSALPGGQLVVPTGSGGTPVDLNFNQALFQASGNLSLAVAGFFAVSGQITVQKTSATVTLADGSSVPVDELVVGASNVSAFAGVNGPASNPNALGLSLSGVDFGLALLKPSSPAAGDLRTWTALQASVTSANFVGVGNLTIGVTSLSVGINQAGGTLAGAPNTTVVDFSSAPLPVGDQMIGFAGPLVQASGTVTIGAYSFFSATGTFTFQKTTGTVKLADGSSVNVNEVAISAIGLSAFIGVGGPASNPGAVGLSLSGVDVGLALLEPSSPAPNDLRTWTALKASVTSAMFVGVSNLTLGITSFAVAVNQAGGTIGAGHTTNTTVVDFSSAPMTVGSQTLDFKGSAGAQVQASGTVTLGAYSFFSASGTLSFQKSSGAVKLAGGASVPVDEVLIGATNVSGFVGTNGPADNPGAVGLSLVGLNLGLALLKPSSPAAGDLRSWTALQASVASASLVGVGNLTLGVTSLTVAINQAGGTINSAANTTVVDFASAPLTAGGQTIKFAGAGPLLQTTGTVTLVAFKFLTVTGQFAFLKTTTSATVTNGTQAGASVLANAPLLTFGISGATGFVGINGGIPNAIGFGLTVNSLALAIIKDPNGTRSWAGISADVSNAVFQGPAGLPITITANALIASINTKATDGTYVDFSQFPGGGLPVATGASNSETIGLSAPLVQVAGNVTLAVDGFAYLSGNLAFSKQGNVSVTPAGSATATDVSLLTVGASNVNAFFGIGGPYWNPDGTLRADAAGALGLALGGVSFGLAIMRPTAANNTTTYFSLKAQATATVVGLSGLTLTGTLNLDINRASDSANPGSKSVPPIDFTKLAGGGLSVPTGPGNATPVVLSDSGPAFQANGNLTLGISTYAYVSGNFAFQEGVQQTVTLQDLSAQGGPAAITQDVTEILVGASGVHAFFGAGGPYWNPDGTLQANAGGAIGLALSNVSFGLALMKPLPTQAVPNPTRSFLALEATGSVKLVGVDGVTFSADSLSIQVNRSSDSQATLVPTVNLTATPVLVPTDADPADDVTLNFASGPIFAAQGSASLTIGSFVSLSGNFAFQQGATQSVTLSDGSTRTVSILEVGASGVNAFVGINGPYWNPDGTLAAGASSAVGVALSNLNFGLALMKDAASTTSFYALSASASSVALVGVPQVTINAQSIVVAVNGTSAAGNAPVVNFPLSFPTTGLAIPTGPSTRAPPINLNFASAILAASGSVALGFSFGTQALSVAANATFQKTSDSAGHPVIEVGVTELAVSLGNPAIISLSHLSGALLITSAGIAGQLSVPIAINLSTFASLSGTLRLSFNNTNVPVDDTFGSPDFTPGQAPTNGTYELKLPAGPYVALGGDSVNLTIGSVVLTGSFELEQVTLPAVNGQPAQTVIRVAASGVSLSYNDSQYGGVSLNQGSGGLIILPGGIAASLSVHFNGSAPAGVNVSAGVTLAINTTNAAVNQTITLDDGTKVTINVAANAFNLFLTNASFTIDNIVTVNVQDFTVQSSTVGGYTVTLYGGKNVTIFIGQGTASNPGIGVEVNAAKLGVVKFANNTNPADITYALYAYGTASLVGIPGLTVSGSLQVLMNKTGRTINQTIQVDPNDPTQTISVVYNSPKFVEQFSAGVDANGTPNPNSLLTIQASKVFTLAGAVQITENPTGTLSIYVPTATVSITIPDSGGNFPVTPTLSVSGTARFTIGGGQGFQLQDLRVNGFSIFGVGATIASPAPAKLPPTADLASPTNGQAIDVAALNQQGYIQVVFNDPNNVGLNVASITGGTPKLHLVGAAAAGVQLNGPGVQVNPNDDTTYRFAFTGQFNANVADPTIQVQFLAGSFSDSQGDLNAAAVEQFTVVQGAPSGNPTPQTSATLASPHNGTMVDLATIDNLGYIDVTFNVPAGGLLSPNGSEIRLTGAGAANLLLDANGSPEAFVNGVATLVPPTQESPDTYRYFLAEKAGAPAGQTLVAGPVNVAFVPATHAATGGQTAPIAETFQVFTVSATNQDAGTSSNAIGLGPLSLQGPSLSLAKVGFSGGNLVLTVAIGVDSASLSFGGSSQNQADGASGEQSSGISAVLTGLLAQFNIDVNIATLASAVTSGNGSAILGAFSVPGKFNLSVAGLVITVPNVLTATASGIQVTYDPAYDPAQHNGQPQQLVSIDSASLTFDRFGLTGAITPATVNGQTIPGLVIFDNGFTLGQAELIYSPSNPSGSNTTSSNPGAPITLGSILQFNDLRIGVQDFSVTFGQAVNFNGSIFIATGGAVLFPGHSISATISSSAPKTGGLAPEAMRATLQFADNRVKAFQFSVDTLTVQISSFVSFTGKNLMLDTGAAANQPLLSVGSIGATVNAGPLQLSGSAQNFQFLGDGTFVPLDGFGVVLGVGAATGSSFQWPSWLPIQISSIGIQWPNGIQNDPTNFVLTLSASVTGLEGLKGLTFAGTIQGIQIDVGKLIAGQFPIVGLTSIGVTVSGNLFGGQIDASLIGGILKLSAAGQMIDPTDTTTPVAARVFFAGLSGGFSFAGLGGFQIQLALSQLGPLGITLSVSTPTGILLDPDTGLTINNFSAGVQFFTTLPSYTDPKQLAALSIASPTIVSPAAWLASVEAQVVKQYQAIQANPGISGFAAAFTSPMLITGSATIYSIYTSQQLFNGQVGIEISTDGKIFVEGILNFAANHLSISGKLYADLSHVASGSVVVLFLAKIPDQVNLLTLDGSIKMGFTNPSGQEVTFKTTSPVSTTPTATIVGPLPGKNVALGAINGEGFVDVTFPTSPANDGSAGWTLVPASVTNLKPAISLSGLAAGSTLALDNSQPSTQVGSNPNTYRFWLTGVGNGDTSASVTFVANTVSYAKSGATPTLNTYTNTINAAAVAHESYVDVTFGPSVASSILTPINVGSLPTDAVQLQSPGSTVVLTGPMMVANAAGPLTAGETQTVRFFVPAGTPLAAGSYTVVIAQGLVADSTSAHNAAASGTFSVVSVSAIVAGPFNTQAPAGVTPSSDVGALNSPTSTFLYNGVNYRYIDVNFTPASGSNLDYASILASPVITLTVGITTANPNGTTITLVATPIPIQMTPDANSILTPTPVNAPGSDHGYDDASLAKDGVTEFRYLIQSTSFNYPVGVVRVHFNASWKDSAGDSGQAGNADFLVQGPTATLAGPAAGIGVDVSTINQHQYIDVILPAPPSGYTIDPASVADLSPEFTLAGAGLGTIKLDGSQAAVLLSGTTYRFWVTGTFAPSGAMTVTFIPGSWSLRPTAYTPSPASASVTLTAPSFLDGFWC